MRLTSSLFLGVHLLKRFLCMCIGFATFNKNYNKSSFVMGRMNGETTPKPFYLPKLLATIVLSKLGCCLCWIFVGPHKLSAEHPVDMAMDDFESRVLGISPKKEGLEDDDFLRELEEIERSATWGATGRRDENELDGEMDEDEDDDEGDEEWEDDRGQVLSDAALAAIVDYDLDDEEKPYQFRPDRYFFPGQKYDPEVIIFISLVSLSSH